MNKFLLLIFICLFSLSFGQNVLDAKIITNENDTIKVKLKVASNMFDPTLLYVSSFSTKVTVIGEDGKKNRIEVPTIKELSLVDFNGKERFFVNNSHDKKSLAEHMFNGKVLDWYRSYSSTNGGENSSDFLFNKITKQGIGVGYFTGLPKKKLKEFFNDEPEMKGFIEEAKSSPLRNAENNITAVMEAIIKKYESLKSNK